MLTDPAPQKKVQGPLRSAIQKPVRKTWDVELPEMPEIEPVKVRMSTLTAVARARHREMVKEWDVLELAKPKILVRGFLPNFHVRVEFPGSNHAWVEVGPHPVEWGALNTKCACGAGNFWDTSVPQSRFPYECSAIIWGRQVYHSEVAKQNRTKADEDDLPF